MNRASLEILARQWRRHRALRELGLLVAVGCGVGGLGFALHPDAAAVLGVLAAVGVGLGLRRRSLAITPSCLAEHLNRRHPELEESAELWLRDAAELGLVERLQLQRLNDSWRRLPGPRPGLPPSGQLLPVWVCAILSVTFLGALIRTPEPTRARTADVSPIALSRTAGASPTITAMLEIQPPAYLGRPSRRLETLSAEVEEGSEVLWSFATEPNVAGLELSGPGTNDPVVAEPAGQGQFRVRRGITDNFVYQISVRAADGARVTLSALHALQVLRDAPPRLTWQLPAAPRTSVTATQTLAPLPIEILATDDHAVAEVRLVLTVVKGAGEGLKFQERSEILPRQSVAGSSNVLCGRSLDLAALGLEPGDELYLQAVALDTRRPTPNEVRSDSRCVALTGPVTSPTAPAVVLSGLRRIPQYFRSQRQLILDTEQLLAERMVISEARFRERSESLGVDQKLLRLRYGQFLGEEFEPTSAGAPREATAQEWAGALRNPVGQDADRTAAIGRAIEATHVHEPGPARPSRPGSAPDLFGLLAHNHDSTEAATLFDEKLKASLRGVLAAMWEAEGFLRTSRPSEALPAEKRALEILKVIQQADRLSVGRVDSESTPLRMEERRLRGELDAIPASVPGTPPTPRNDPDANALRLAVASLLGSGAGLIPPDQAARVEELLWHAAQAQPERYLPALEQWRSREATVKLSGLEALRKAMGSLLPATEEAPVRRRSSSRPSLENRYAEALAVPSPGTP